MKLAFSFIFLIQFSLVSAQATNEFSNYHSKKIMFIDSLILDELPILPNSIKLKTNNKEIDISLFQIDYVHSSMKSTKRFKDTIEVSYRTIPLKKSNFVLAKSTSFKQMITPVPNFSDPMDAQNLTNDISYSGSFVRGITMGSRQDAAVNSGFNLNIQGRLSNGLEIVAAMSDANIPIQPEGNSASIQEFDKIYIQLRKDSHQITLGDFDLQNLSPFYFQKFDRKLQGIKYQTAFDLGKKTNLKLGSAVAVTRGTFARNVFQAIENNQGPYKLTGNNGESFIIIIAGTERVFINGIQLKRGLENDYTINYNIGEIVFTHNRLITQDLRIVVEFQYSDRNFFRYSLEGNAQLTHKNTQIISQIYTENDNRNQPVNQTLTPIQIIKLSEIGNQLDSAITISARQVDWESARITYQQIDTFVNSTRYTIYQWAQIKSSPVYQVIYSQQGANKGNYRLKSSAANGIVYEWIAPVNGILQGNYEPLIRLSTPKSQLQWTTQIQQNWSPNQKSTIEVSYSDQDVNTFSDIQQNENKGMAINFNHNIVTRFNENKSLKIDLSQEFSSQHFSPLTRYRSNEFQRDWSLDLPIRNNREQSISSFATEYNSKSIHSKLGGKLFYIPNYFIGLESNISMNWTWKMFNLSTNHRLINSTKGDSTNLFYRPNFTLGYDFIPNKLKIEFGLTHELNKMKTPEIAVTKSSFYWQNYLINIRSNLSQKNMLNFSYIYRTEQQGDTIDFADPKVISHTFGIDGNQEFSLNQSIKYSLKYRNFNSTILNQDLIHNYLGKIDYSSHYLRGVMRWNSVYEVKAGREQKLQQTYIHAPNGYGNFAWQDLNKNNIFELNEAYVSPILTENNYMRYFFALPEFLPTNEVNFSQMITIQPRVIWHESKGIAKTLAKFSYQMRLDVNKKTKIFNGIDLLDYANPLSTANDSLLVFSRSIMFQQISFQKNENKLGFDLEWLNSKSNNLLSNGVEGFAVNTIAFKSRVELLYFLTYSTKLSNTAKKNFSEFFSERNFSTIENSIDNTLSFIINQNYKLNLNANYGFKSTGIQYAITQQGDLELKIARKNDGIVESRMTLLNLNYQANTSNPQVELAMLNGIPKGLNLIWNLTIGQKVTKFLQLNIIYNGRKNTDADAIIHSGNVEARAIF